MATELQTYLQNTYGGSSNNVSGGVANPDYYSAKWYEAKQALDSGKMSAADFAILSDSLHRAAEEVRSTLGYSGGADGGKVIVTNDNLFQSIVEKVTNRTAGETVGSVDESVFTKSFAGNLLNTAIGGITKAGSGTAAAVDNVVRTASNGISAVGSSVSGTTSSGASGFGNLVLIGGVILLGLSLGRRK